MGFFEVGLNTFCLYGMATRLWGPGSRMWLLEMDPIVSCMWMFGLQRVAPLRGMYLRKCVTVGSRFEALYAQAMPSVEHSSLLVTDESRCRTFISFFSTMSAFMSHHVDIGVDLLKCKPAQMNFFFLYKSWCDHCLSSQQ